MKYFPLDHLNPKFHKLSSPKRISQSLSSLHLDALSGLTATTSSDSLFQPFTTRTADGSFLTLVVIRPRAIIFPFPLSASFTVIINRTPQCPGALARISKMSNFLNESSPSLRPQPLFMPHGTRMSKHTHKDTPNLFQHFHLSYQNWSPYLDTVLQVRPGKVP